MKSQSYGQLYNIFLIKNKQSFNIRLKIMNFHNNNNNNNYNRNCRLIEILQLTMLLIIIKNHGQMLSRCSLKEIISQTNSNNYLKAQNNIIL
ncbi:unnamed protein product [Paramecium sonneborni]|uniref:Uncharacterized protein n=1 Tax=Paramecium sonneborni TaxID=65129 RepID=A0A8S1RVE5_9CILI|nr:unnamed protein product [Paramecium sonneborni]